MIIEKVRLFTSMLILLLASEVGSAEQSPLIAMDEENIRQRLDACLLTDLGYVQGPDAWASHADPFPPVELGDPNKMEKAVQ